MTKGIKAKRQQSTYSYKQRDIMIRKRGGKERRNLFIQAKGCQDQNVKQEHGSLKLVSAIKNLITGSPPRILTFYKY